MAAPNSAAAPMDPFRLTDREGFAWLKGNLHTHTTCSDGRATPQQRLEQYAARGYDFICLSDHGRITPVDELAIPAGMTVIPGAELHPHNPFGGQVHHFLALGLRQDIDCAGMAPQHVIDSVRAQGASVWLAHPYWSSVSTIRDVLPLRDLAGMEVFNTTCHRNARGESSVHWNDWMEQTGRLVPALATDDAHAAEADQHDTYGGWTMVRVRQRDPDSIRVALEQGLCYSTTGPRIDSIELRRQPDDDRGQRAVTATVRCSEAQAIQAIYDVVGTLWRRGGQTFEEATFALAPHARWVRFEVIAPDGSKAWSNPFALDAVTAG